MDETDAREEDRMTREELIEWVMKNPELIVGFIEKLLVEVALSDALEMVIERERKRMMS